MVKVWIKVLQPGDRADEILGSIERRAKADSIDRLGRWAEVHFSRGDLDYAEAQKSVEDAQRECGDGSREFLRVMDSPQD
ncbi:MAG TPA: hypothetical protein VFT14_07045 [Solirubrobacterales bacterium]|nr:hypothetical protein [Solirubrobacterales bacterium]